MVVLLLPAERICLREYSHNQGICTEVKASVLMDEFAARVEPRLNDQPPQKKTPPHKLATRETTSFI